MRRARRYILRLRPDGDLRVTIPRGGSRAEALRFAERHLEWATRQRAKQQLRPAALPGRWTDGTTILIDGEPAIIRCAHENGRIMARAASIAAPLGSLEDDVRPALVQAMRTRARAELIPQLHALAAGLGLEVAAVSIRDQRSRWGSCSTRGHIALNYRLLQMPPDVREYILLHELMHLRQPNHSRRFWSLVEKVCPRFRDAERWLKTIGQGLL
jgi:predicted metal-dependent hydrolase